LLTAAMIGLGSGFTRKSTWSASMPRSGRNAAPAHLVDVAVFCDSDDTHMASISYFAYVRLEQETDRGRTILFNSNTFRDGQYAKKALLVLEALTADDRRRLGADYAAVIVEGAKRPAEATSIPE
jgi:hypothetical protein